MQDYTNLFAYQGADFSAEVEINADDGTSVNLTNYTFTGIVRNNYYSANAAANLAFAVDAANGNVTISLDAANTANMEYGTYLYTVMMVSNLNVSSVLLQGQFLITPSVIMTQPITNP